jgi:hypothetical protein
MLECSAACSAFIASRLAGFDNGRDVNLRDTVRHDAEGPLRNQVLVLFHTVAQLLM